MYSDVNLVELIVDLNGNQLEHSMDIAKKRVQVRLSNVSIGHSRSLEVD